jgi:hypothetical protein
MLATDGQNVGNPAQRDPEKWHRFSEQIIRKKNIIQQDQRRRTVAGA